MKDFDRWNRIKKKTDLSNSEIMIREGEISWCKFGVSIGYETFGKGQNFSRPVLIIKKFSSDVFWGVPLTSGRRVGSWYFYLKNRDETLILNQMKLLDRKRLENRISEISRRQLKIIKSKIAVLIKY